MFERLRRGLTLRREVFPSDETVVDVGVGDRRRGTLGVDIKHADGVDILGDGRHLPIATDTVDAVVCYHLLEHLRPSEAVLALSEFNRVLKLGGRLYLLVDRDVSPDALFEKDPTHVYRYIPDILRQYIAEGHWEVELFQTHNLLGNIHNHPLTWWKYVPKATKIYIEAVATERPGESGYPSPLSTALIGDRSRTRAQNSFEEKAEALFQHHR